MSKEMSKEYEVIFAPIDVLSYTFMVDAKNEAEAMRKAGEQFEFDIGYDRAKDFDVIKCVAEEDE
tara:strand:+ start:294 stop:488 length:195 start_codon:yes stop_codon:yes gene_type:complete